jgi:steroid delta-isomerase-like uncharacterized protein
MATETLLHRWFNEVWNQGRESSISELMADDAIFHGIVDYGSNEVRGQDGFRAYYKELRTTFPDIHFTVEDAVVEGDRIAVRCVVTATHTGPGITPAPTQQPISVSGMVFARTRDGKLVEGWNNFDLLALYQQVGMKLS